MGRSGTALGLIGIIIGAVGVGFAFIVWNGQNTTNSDLDDLRDELNNFKSDFNNLITLMKIKIMRLIIHREIGFLNLEIIT